MTDGTRRDENGYILAGRADSGRARSSCDGEGAWATGFGAAVHAGDGVWGLLRCVRTGSA